MKLSHASLIFTALKGSPITILLLMWSVQKNQKNWSRDELSDLLGLSPKTVANGLKALSRNNLVNRINSETWQLAPAGHVLDFEQILAQNGRGQIWEHELHESGKNGLSGGGGFKEIHESLHDSSLLKPPPLEVEILPFDVVRETIINELKDELIACGSDPKAALESVCMALENEPDSRVIRWRILWWRGYAATQKHLKFAGNLIAARVKAGIDTPVDFTMQDWPDKLFDLKGPLEDLERSIRQDDKQNQ